MGLSSLTQNPETKREINKSHPARFFLCPHCENKTKPIKSRQMVDWVKTLAVNRTKWSSHQLGRLHTETEHGSHWKHRAYTQSVQASWKQDTAVRRDPCPLMDSIYDWITKTEGISQENVPTECLLKCREPSTCSAKVLPCRQPTQHTGGHLT